MLYLPFSDNSSISLSIAGVLYCCLCLDEQPSDTTPFMFLTTVVFSFSMGVLQLFCTSTGRPVISYLSVEPLKRGVLQLHQKQLAVKALDPFDPKDLRPSHPPHQNAGRG